MTSKDSSVNRSEPATRAEATREPKGAGKRIRLWAIAGSSILLAAVLSVAITLGIQSHNDQVLSAQTAQSESELRTLGAQIAAIKDHSSGL